MTMLLPKLGSNYVFVFSFVLVGCIFFCAGNLFNYGSMASGQLTNSSAPGDDEILANINQTYLSLIPLMIQEVQNTNASDIPIRQIIEATPSNATQLQDIVKNNSYNSSIQSELNSTYDNTTLTNSSVNNMPSKPQDLIPVVVNMTQNTNASNIPFSNVLNTVPSNATQLQDIVKNNSYNSSIQSELNSTYDNTTLTNSSVNNMPSKPQDLIPVVVNMTQNTNATELGFMRVINSTPTIESFNGTNTN